jgi:hypothetical protein
VRLRMRAGIPVAADQGKAQEGFDRFIGRPPIALSQVLSPAGTRYGYALKGQVRLCEPKKQGVLTSACKARSVRSRIRPSFVVLAGSASVERSAARPLNDILFCGTQPIAAGLWAINVQVTGRGGMGDERGSSNLRSLLRSIDAPPLGAVGDRQPLGGATTSTWIGGNATTVV